jgi:putative zinc finger/helix-turn-helix YgiT family protein
MKRTSKTRCPECDKGTLEAKRADLTGKTHGESFTIQSEGLVCPKCGFKTIPTERMGEFALRVADAWREKHGLLTSAQIRGRRTDLGMSQRQFATYLGVGVASIKRWELGQIQDEAMNNLMVLKTDLAAAKRNLVEIAARRGAGNPRPASNAS